MDPKQIPTKRRVHIVDDESEVCEALALLLSTAGIETAAHGSAEAYLETVPLAEPACVILDNRLPGLSGLELLRRIADSG
ncbi:MAG TPA: response regulator, partial [Roseiarcus sp.]